MAKEETGRKANIGSSSLILIFIVMCLVTFGMLSLSASKNQLDLAERNRDAVKEYYRADSEAVAFYEMVLEKTDLAVSKSRDSKERENLLKSELGEFYQMETGAVFTEIPMERAQALYVELFVSLEGPGTVEVKQWKVIQTEDFEIDQAMPVWTGTGE